ncbi:MAG: ABC transporter ATP-binding protein [Rhizobiales bacterium 62-17]|nr:ABC transporter ATP-binding protein [Hyphomicrobiales bacterium]OJY02374.1 MAG: ABC transporter ATP-binding protein [Rhizobiales bacterium 62-17]
MTAILTLEKLSKRFGAVTVADALDLTLVPGEALGIIGPNGAGKTSLFNMIAGAIKPNSGRVLFEARDITALSPAQRCRIGIGRSFQIPQPFSGLTVFENLCVPGFFGNTRSNIDVTQRCVEVLELTGLLPKANAVASSLTLLERKRLELARALAGNPKLLLLDEIAGGLTPHECEELVAAILKVRQTGVAIIWIEHVVHALLATIDRLMVLHQGRKLMDGDPKTVMATREVREIYLGVEADA